MCTVAKRHSGSYCSLWKRGKTKRESTTQDHKMLFQASSVEEHGKCLDVLSVLLARCGGHKLFGVARGLYILYAKTNVYIYIVKMHVRNWLSLKDLTHVVAVWG